MDRLGGADQIGAQQDADVGRHEKIVVSELAIVRQFWGRRAHRRGATANIGAGFVKSGVHVGHPEGSG